MPEGPASILTSAPGGRRASGDDLRLIIISLRTSISQYNDPLIVWKSTAHTDCISHDRFPKRPGGLHPTTPVDRSSEGLWPRFSWLCLTFPLLWVLGHHRLKKWKRQRQHLSQATEQEGPSSARIARDAHPLLPLCPAERRAHSRWCSDRGPGGDGLLPPPPIPNPTANGRSRRIASRSASVGSPLGAVDAIPSLAQHRVPLGAIRVFNRSSLSQNVDDNEYWARRVHS